MKKAQLETMGLVVIIVLLAFILVFVLQIMVKPEANTLNSRYMQLNADNLRSSILKTSICNEINLKDEIVNCNSFNNVQCDNLQDCNSLNNLIRKMIEDSLNVTRKYKFTAGDILVEKNFNLCKDIYSSVSEPIPYSDINITLLIC